MNDKEAMQQAIAYAHSVEGRTAPRPPVGAIVVNNGIVIGRGATSPPYGPHAEIHALTEAGIAARGSDLYTTLEPCCVAIHTPPCTEAIIAAGVRRVVIGIPDPHPAIQGRGITQLEAAGIECVLSTEQQQRAIAELVAPFATYVTYSRPYVTAKWAMTLDGKIATHTGDAFWVSGDAAQAWVHNLRDCVDAILVGAGTARRDNPQLTVRLSPEQEQRTSRQGPLRVILASRGLLPDMLALLQPHLAAGTCVIVDETCSREACQKLTSRGLEVIPVAADQHGQVDVLAALEALAHKGIMHVLIEGGAKVLGSAFDRGCIDHIAAIIAPKIVGGASAPSPIGGYGRAEMRHACRVRNLRTQVLGSDMLIEGDINYGKEP